MRGLDGPETELDIKQEEAERGIIAEARALILPLLEASMELPE